MIKNTLVGGVAAAALSLSLTGTAFAGYDVNSRIDSLENELRELKAQMQMRDSKLAELETATEGLGDLPKFDARKLQISSRDGNWSIRFGGRLMLDAFLADAERTGAADSSGGGAEIRRARFFASGKIAGDWKYKLQVDFASNGVSIKTATISTKIAGLTTTFGNDKEPQGLEELTSSKYITFMERSLVNETFAPGRNLGVSVGTGGDNYSVRGGFYTNGIDNGSDAATTDWSLTGRVTFAPIAEKTEVVHLGVSGSYRGFDDNSGPRIRLRNFHNGTRFLDSGTITSEGQMTLGAEAAAVFGPFSAQGEYYTSTLEGNGTGSADIDFDGWYVMASYFITGESRAYKADKGEFGRVKSEGAIEVAARYEMIDLEDAGFGAGAADTTALTLGVNYYFNPYVRAMLNYGTAEYDFTTASGTADTEVDFIGTRLQLDF
ncbi:MAG: OprO/OprP family phosphate-selective porin [Rhodobiaceae bacterium]|nr:porin P [Rhodobiaceae bacterium]MCR9242509.1 OprO/OprP family phosphate-selective porin [Rhodobiaceae bacterium]